MALTDQDRKGFWKAWLFRKRRLFPLVSRRKLHKFGELERSWRGWNCARTGRMGA